VAAGPLSPHPHLVLRALAPGDEAEPRRILATPEVAVWWDAPDEGVPWTDEHGATAGTTAC
jgi:hypothetical protein